MFFFCFVFSRSVQSVRKLTMLMIFQSLDVRSETGIKKHCYGGKRHFDKFFLFRLLRKFDSESVL